MILVRVCNRDRRVILPRKPGDWIFEPDTDVDIIYFVLVAVDFVFRVTYCLFFPCRAVPEDGRVG